ncbi:Leucine-rich repeat-containing protein C22orf36, partial [Ophiophagus hannah]
MWSWSSEELLVFFKLLFGLLTSTCILFFGAAVAYLMPLSQGGTGAAALRQASSLLWPAPIPKELREGEQEPLPGAEEKRERMPESQRDLGLEGTFLNEVLYKKATFLNLVDPISHDLLMSLARDLQCPKKEYDPWKSSDRICRQLIYHLTPHSKWHRSGLPHRKSHSSLKSSLQKQLGQEAIHLSGVPLSTRDIQHLASYLQGSGDHLLTIDLSFTSLKDEEMRFLMPFLRSLPSLTHLFLNGNHLTRATVKDLTDAMKDMAKFPSLAWIDLGNNVDVSSMPQPLLVGLRKRLSQQTMLPTIYESLDCASEASSGPETSLLEEKDLQGEEGILPVAKHCFHQQSCER